jgi:Flp pilus assembly pilin Flp
MRCWGWARLRRDGRHRIEVRCLYVCHVGQTVQGMTQERKVGKDMKSLVKRFLQDEQGMELSEYALMIALLIVIAVITIKSVGQKISDLFGVLLEKLSGV